MGSGAKIALVALLILMVVAVAKFVQNGSDEAAQSAAAKKDSPAGPRFASQPGATAAPNQPKRPLISSRSSPSAPAGKESPQQVTKPSQPADQKPAPRPEPSISQGPAPAPSAPKQVNTPPATVGSTLVPAAVKPPEAERSQEQRSEISVAQAGHPVNPIGNINRDLAPPSGRQGSDLSPKTFGSDLPPRASAKDDAAGPPSSSPPETGALSAASTFPQSHKVESGDSYWRIAEKYYGTGRGKLYKAIAGANGNATLIPGKTIKVPAPPADAAAPPAHPSGPAAARTAQPVAQNTDGEFEYIVQRGDNLIGLAKKFSRKQKDIENANPSLQYLGLRAGAKIVIPKRSI